MVLILDDAHLEALQCSQCRKYLSMFPVKNHSSRDVTCGRCSDGVHADKEDGVRSDLYELVAKEYIFKCVNRYEGCRKLLRTGETKEHEKVCVGNVFDCPKCQDGIVRSILDLIWHYKVQHPSSYLKKNCFEGKVPIDDAMLYLQDEVVFFILFKNESNQLRFSAATLTKTNATQTFAISQGSFCKLTEIKSCESINALDKDYFNVNLDSVESVRVIFNLEVSKRDEKLFDVSVLNIMGVDPTGSEVGSKASVSDENTLRLPIQSTSKVFNRSRPKVGSKVNVLKEKKFYVKVSKELEKYICYKLNDSGTVLILRNGQKIELTCSNCKQFISLSFMYRCNVLKHQICLNCRNWCGICDAGTSSIEEWNSTNLLNKVIQFITFPCKWKCGNYYFTDDLKFHEKICTLRILKCPICRSVTNSLNLFKNHLLNNHQILHFYEGYQWRYIRNLAEKNNNGKLIFLLHDEFCYIKWSQTSDILHYDLYFGLFKDEPNVKLGMVYEVGNMNRSNRKCLYDVMRKVNIYRDYYGPYINFNYEK